MERMGLEDILSDKAPPAAEPAAEPAKEPSESPPEKPASVRQKHRDIEQSAQGRVRDPETGQYAPRDEPKPEPKIEARPEPKPEPKPEVKPEAKAQEMSEKERALLAAAQDERRKRQEAERERDELRKRPVQTEPPKTFWDDPDTALANLRGEFERQNTKTRLDTFEQVARIRHPDYDARIQEFRDMVQDNPALFHEALRAPDPAEYAYKSVVRQKALQEMGDPEAYRAKIEKELRIKFEAEQKEREESRKKEQDALPGSISNVTGVGNVRPVWGGPTPLDKILKS